MKLGIHCWIQWTPNIWFQFILNLQSHVVPSSNVLRHFTCDQNSPHDFFFIVRSSDQLLYSILNLFYIPINSKIASTLLYWLKHWAAHVVASNVALLYMRSKFPLAVLGNTRLDRSTKRVCTGTPACIK